MGVRTIGVALVATSTVPATLTRDAQAIERFAGKAEGANRRVGASAKQAAVDTDKAATRSRAFFAGIEQGARRNQASLKKVGDASLAIGAGLAIGVGLAVREFAKFDQAMSRAAAGTDATGREMDQLTQAAIDAGARTKFSAVEAADAITALGKAGVSVRDILAGGLNGALDLAAAGQLEVAAAAEIAATAMTQFGLRGQDLPHVADLLAAGAGKAQGEVTDLANALKYVGPVAKGMGVSIEETTGALALFASQGIIGEQAGTSLRGMLSSLTSPSQKAAKEMQRLGLNLYDAQGGFVGLDGVAAQLQESLGGMSEAQRNASLGVIFGNEQLTAARVLYEGGARAVTEWTRKVNDAGFAERQASRLANNLVGDLEQLRGSLSSVFIKGGTGADSPLRALTQDAKAAVDAFGGLSPELQSAAFEFAALTAVTLLAGGAAVKTVRGYLELKAALAGVGLTAGRTRTALAALSTVGVIAAGANIFGSLIADSAVADVNTRKLADSLAKLGESGKLSGEGRALFEPGFLGRAASGFRLFSTNVDTSEEALKRFGQQAQVALGGGLQSIHAKLTGRNKAFEQSAGQLDQALASLVQNGRADAAAAGFSRLAEAAHTVPIDKLREAFPQYQAALDGVTSSGEALNPVQAQTASTLNQVGLSAGRAKEAMTGLQQSLDAANNAFLTGQAAQDGYEAALDSIAGAVKDNGRTFDATSEKGRANRAALRELAAAGNAYLTEIADSKGVGKQFNREIERQRDNLIKAGKRFGLTGEEAKRYADRILRIPKRAATEVRLTGAAAASARLTALRGQITSLPDGTVRIRTVTTDAQGNVQSRTRFARAGGGLMTGPGTTTSDSIPAWLSTGEYVQRAAAVRFYGVEFMEQLNRMQFPKYAGGGHVGGLTVLNPPAQAGRVQVDVAPFRVVERQDNSQTVHVGQINSDAAFDRWSRSRGLGRGRGFSATSGSR